MPKAKSFGAGKKKAEVESESDDDDYTWKPSWQQDEEKRTRSAETSRKKPIAKSKKPPRPSSSAHASDDDDESSGTPTKASSSSSLHGDDEKEEDDGDRDEWRTSNRHVTAKHRADPAYIAQDEKWRKFRAEFPVPLRQPLSAGIILGLRRALKQRKKLVTSGVPIHLRRDIWEILSGARAFPEKLEHSNRYQHYLKHPPAPSITKSIQTDAHRALRGHMKFTTKTGQAELTAVLTAFAARTPAVGYASPMSHVAAFLLLFYPPERTFWMLCTLVDIILPPDYYSQSLLGARADGQLLKILVFQRLPKVHSHLNKHGLDVALIGLKWMMPLFLTTLPTHVCIRLFDVIMLEGSTFLLSVGLALFHLHSKKLLSLNDSGELFEYVEKLGSEDKSLDTDLILKESLTTRCGVSEEDLKRRDVERRIMESAYLKELQASVKFKEAEEERKKKEMEMKQKELAEQEKALEYGTEMWKVGKTGKPKRIQIYLRNETVDESDVDKRIYVITWDSKTKQPGEARMLLRDCELWLGLGHGQFARRADMTRMFAGQTTKAWSVVGAVRSLDLVCLTEFDFEEWMNVLKRVPMKAKHFPGKPGKISMSADASEDEEEEKKVKGNTKTASGSALGTGAGSGSGSSRTGTGLGAGGAGKGLTRLQQAREERAARGEGPAANKLAALLKHGAPPAMDVDISDDEDEPAQPRKGKR